MGERETLALVATKIESHITDVLAGLPRALYVNGYQLEGEEAEALVLASKKFVNSLRRKAGKEKSL